MSIAHDLEKIVGNIASDKLVVEMCFPIACVSQISAKISQPENSFIVARIERDIKACMQEYVRDAILNPREIANFLKFAKLLHVELSTLRSW